MSEDGTMHNAANEEKALEWSIEIVLSSPEGDLIKESLCTELLNQIIDWVELKGLQVGGGIKPLSE